jgi:hypothetical protein
MDDLDALRDIQDEAKNRVAMLLRNNVKVGDNVRLLPKHQGSRPYDQIGTVKKVNPKRFRVAFPMGNWTIPHSMVEKVED